MYKSIIANNNTQGVEKQAQPLSRTSWFHQSDLPHHAEGPLLRQTVGHVEVEALRDDYLAVALLVLPAAVHLLLGAQRLHLDARVAGSALGLGDHGEGQVGVQPGSEVGDPGGRGGGLHPSRPAGRRQKVFLVFLRSDVEYVGLCVQEEMSQVTLNVSAIERSDWLRSVMRRQ